MKYIICNNQEEFDSINLTIQVGLSRDIPRYNAERWALPTICPEDGCIAIIIEDGILKYLTQTQKDRVIELTEDWFNAEE